MGQVRWIQPQHSGENQDVWALDDIALTSTMHNTIELHFNKSSTDDVQQTLDSHFAIVGSFCGRDNSLRYYKLPLLNI